MPQEPLFAPINWRRYKSGDIIVTFDLARSWQRLNPFYWLSRFLKWLIKSTLKVTLVPLFHFFQGLDRLLAHRAQIVIASGLGLGVGLSLVWAQTPIVLQAVQPEISQVTGALPNQNLAIKIYPQQLVVADRRLDLSLAVVDEIPGNDVSWYTDRSGWYWSGSAGLGQPEAILIGAGSRSHLGQSQPGWTLGETVEVIGTNHGRYRFTITEIKTVATNQIPALVQQLDQPKLMVVIAPVPVWQTETTLLIGSPAL